MVLASLRAPASGVYVVQDVCRLPEPVDTELLRHAWQLVSQRHPALRTSIQFENGSPVAALVHHHPPVRWRQLSEAQPDQELAGFLRRDRELGFNFYDGVPVRIAVLRPLAGDNVIVWTSHHALLDGRSLLVVWKEWLALYEGLVRGESVLLPEPPAARDVAPLPPEAEQYWHRCFEGVSHTTDYLVDRTRTDSSLPAEEPVARESVRFSEGWTREIHEFARRHEITVNTLVQAAWALLLSRYSGRGDVVFGVTRAGRGSQPEDADRVGLFINTLPLRITVDGASSLIPWLKLIRSRWIEMRPFERTPLEHVMQGSGLPTGMPPFESLVVYEHVPPSEGLRQLGGLWQGRTLCRFQRTDSQLTLAAYGHPALTLELIYDTQRFTSRAMAAAAGHLGVLLRSFVTRPEARLKELALLTEDEWQWLRRENSRTSLAYPPQLCAHHLFERQVTRTPYAMALDAPSGSLTYQELDRQSERLALCLHGIGAGPEGLVAVCMNASVEAVVTILAVLKAGAAFLPLDPELPPDRLRSMLRAAGPSLVVGTRETTALFEPDAEYRTVTVEQLLRSSPPPQNLHNCAAPSDTAYVIFTSGTTGIPKAILVPHRALVNHTLGASAIFGIDERDRRLQFVSIGADVFVAEVFNYLAHGGALVLGWSRKNASVREFLRYLEEQRITITGIPAPWWNEWVAALGQPGYEMPRSLRAVIVGMERMNPTALAAWRKSTSIRLFNAYGPAETSPTTTIYEAGTSDWESECTVPIGTPIANMRCHVLDEAGNPVPAGVPGELYIAGPGVSCGYLNAPELTARRFVADPFHPGLMYRTGDFVYRLPDGNLVFLGRADRQVKFHGFRVELEEIEAVLSGHDMVRECAAIAAGGEGRERLIACFVPQGAPTPSADQLRSFLALRLPAHMIPTAVTALSELPRTANGKTDYRALAALPLDTPQRAHQFRQPATPTEHRLAALWCEVLGLPRAGLDDNFFELGGGSLQATRLITRIEKEFGQEIPLALLWRLPTVALLAAHLEESVPPAVAQEDAGVLALQPAGSRPPLFCITSIPEDALRFTGLPPHLGEDQPLFAIPNPMLREETVEEAARRVCTFIRAVRARGPYVLGGYCFGGILAFEAARQLAEAGEVVRRVVLFDVSAPGPLHWFRNPPAKDLSPPLGLLAEIRAALRHAVTLLHARVQGHFVHVGRAARAYTPRPTSIPVVHFVAREDPLTTWLVEDRRLAWRRLCLAGFQVHTVPGTHGLMFSPPHVAELAALLKSL